MVKRRLYEVTVGVLGTVAAYLGIVRYLSHPDPGGLVLAMGILSLFLCLQSFSGASGEARSWMARALGCIAIAYGMLTMFTEKREEFWAFLGLVGVLFGAAIIFFTFTYAKGYRWRRGGAKTLPPAKEGDEGV